VATVCEIMFGLSKNKQKNFHILIGFRRSCSSWKWLRKIIFVWLWWVESRVWCYSARRSTSCFLHQV